MEKAISPLWGVVLMVLITIALAAIITWFVSTLPNFEQPQPIKEAHEQVCTERCNSLNLNYSHIEGNCKPFCLCMCTNGSAECMYSATGECKYVE